MMTTDINNRQEFDHYMQVAITKMTKLEQDEPDDKILFAVLRQLKAIEQWTAGGMNMTDAQKKKIVMGLQAGRQMQDYPIEQELVNALNNYIDLQMPNAPEP